MNTRKTQSRRLPESSLATGTRTQTTHNKHRYWLAVASVAAALAVGGGTAEASRWYVDANSSASSPDGTTWSKAFVKLDPALSRAGAGDEIWVAKGTYRPGGSSREHAFVLPDGVTLLGGFYPGALSTASRDPNAYRTRLSGDINTRGDTSDNSHTVVLAASVSAVVLDGFIILDGNANTTGVPNGAIGGGLLISDAAITVKNCRFRNNLARSGGAVYIENGSDVTILNSIFRSNSAGTGGGGAIDIVAPQDNEGRCEVMVEGSSFVKNTAVWGGAIRNKALLNVYSSVFRSNKATDAGGAIYSPHDVYEQIRLKNVTVAFNEAINWAGGVHVSHINDVIENSIFWDNQGPGWPSNIEPYGLDGVNYCCVEGLAYLGLSASAVGNIDDDPRFRSTTDLHLRRRSPCLEAGDESLYPYWLTDDLDDRDRVAWPYAWMPLGGTDIEIDMGAYERHRSLSLP